MIGKRWQRASAKFLKQTTREANSTQEQPSDGFTLVELLITAFIGALITSGLLALSVQIIRSERIEEARTETQRDMQRALDYIANDLKEAVYVYGNEQQCNQYDSSSCPPYEDYVGTVVTTSNQEPVLAFWKLEPIDVSQLPSNCSTSSNPDECEDLKRKRHTFTLVIYAQRDANYSASSWQGESIIRRYELKKYTTSNLSSLTVTDGYVDPSDYSSSFFATWPRTATGDAGNLQTNTPAWNENALVDFVDTLSSATTSGSDCPTDYLPTPINASEVLQSTSFYACVRNIDQEVGLPQDVIIYLRGNTEGQLPPGFNDGPGPLPILQTQVTVGGVIDRYVE